MSKLIWVIGGTVIFLIYAISNVIKKYGLFEFSVFSFIILSLVALFAYYIGVKRYTTT